LIIYGGENNRFILSDVWEFSLTSLKWRQLSTTGFKPRASHEILYEYKQIYIIGGKNSLKECSNTIEIRIRKEKGLYDNDITNIRVLGLEFDLFKRYINQDIYQKEFLFNNFDDSFVAFQKIFDIDEHKNNEFEDLSLFLPHDSPLTDCQVILSDDTVRSHKILLLSTCKELKQHLEGDSFKLQHITKSQYEIIKKVLFVNNLDIGEVSEINALDLLKISYDYKIERLKIYCEDAIFKKINFWNIYDVYELGEQYGSQYMINFATYQLKINYYENKNDPRFGKLKKSVQRYIQENAWPGDKYWEKLKKYEIKLKNKRKKKELSKEKVT